MTTCDRADRLKQSLLVHAPGSTDAIVQLELFNTMDNFFRRTNAWRMESDFTLEVSTGVTEYAIPVPVGSTMVRLMGVAHNGIPVPPAASAGGSVSSSSFGSLDPAMVFPDGDAMFNPDMIDLNVSNIFSYAIYRPGYITIGGGVSADMARNPLVAAFSLSLAKSCLECDCGDWDIPDWMWDSFFEAWYNGSLTNLYGMPNKPWSNAQLAVLHGKRFRNKMAFHKQEAQRGFNYGVPNWKFPRVGGWV